MGMKLVQDDGDEKEGQTEYIRIATVARLKRRIRLMEDATNRAIFAQKQLLEIIKRRRANGTKGAQGM